MTTLCWGEKTHWYWMTMSKNAKNYNNNFNFRNEIVI